MYCPNCGAPISDTAKFCPQCGKPIPRSDGQNVTPAPYPQQSYSQASGTGYQQNSAQTGYQQNSAQTGYQQDFSQAGYEQTDPQNFYQNGSAPGGPSKRPSFWDQIPTFAKILIPALAVIALVLIGILLFTGKDNKKNPSQTANNSSSQSASGQNSGQSGSDQDAQTGDSGSHPIPTPAPGMAVAEIVDANGNKEVVSVSAIPRPDFLNGLRYLTETEDAPASVPDYEVSSDFSNVINIKDFYFSDKQKAAILANYFFIMARNGGDEFFETYEQNRYALKPSFVTTDSMMHVYHLYFSHLMKNTERNYLSDSLAKLASGMLERSAAQLETLRGTEWEKAALTNTAFFAVGASLLDQPVQIPADAAEIAQKELDLIYEAAGITVSPLLNIDSDGTQMEDYSQYIVRGYYEGDALLEKYFRAMMWFGRVNFTQRNETMDRAALLTTLCLDDQTRPLWEAIYSVTSFFAGASDDSGYYEYRPIIDTAYGENATVSDLPGNEVGWMRFHSLTEAMEPPKINSTVVMDTGTEDDHVGENKGFRFMGQRFSIDAAIFQNLLYNIVEPTSSGEKRLLPDALDIPAALGSDAALSILENRGNFQYPNYSEQMTKLRTAVNESGDDLWNASLYSKWLDTLRPALEVKGEGYPPFMKNDQWTRKNLQTFLGSYAELKHDTVLYAKQVMVEMGGDDFGPKDDRGYVEPEPELFGKLADLTMATADGLASYGLLGSEDAENLERLATLADELRVIAEKELRGELPSDEEFELIRTYGGQLEHFWAEVYKDEATSERFTSRDFPGAIVTDVATDPNGRVLQLGTGQCGEIFVIVPVDGTLRIAVGTVYSFYQFDHPSSDRLTDSKWRVMMGIEMNSDGRYNQPSYALEDWTRDFQYTWEDIQ